MIGSGEIINAHHVDYTYSIRTYPYESYICLAPECDLVAGSHKPLPQAFLIPSVHNHKERSQVTARLSVVNPKLPRRIYYLSTSVAATMNTTLQTNPKQQQTTYDDPFADLCSDIDNTHNKLVSPAEFGTGIAPVVAAAAVSSKQHQAVEDATENTITVTEDEGEEEQQPVLKEVSDENASSRKKESA